MLVTVAAAAAAIELMPHVQTQLWHVACTFFWPPAVSSPQRRASAKATKRAIGMCVVSVFIIVVVIVVVVDMSNANRVRV